MTAAFQSAAVIGLGLMGGSVARDLRALGVRVTAYDRDATQLAAAVRANVLDSTLDASLDGLRSVDVVIIAVPVDGAIDVLRRVATCAPRARLVTDVGSTKMRIVEAASAVGAGLSERFVGAHPMSGDHRSGWGASREGMFRDSRVFLCPAREAAPHAIELASTFWRALGANPELIDAEAHDLKLAWASHLPHVLSASLALALARGGIRRDDLGPGGKDMTRLAGSSPDLWTAIAGENAEAIRVALREAERTISGFRQAIEKADTAALKDRFVRAREWFDE